MTQPLRLSGRTAVITGAGGGIGRAIALSLARRGCGLALADIDLAAAQATAGAATRDHGVRAEAYRLDVADRPAVAAFAGQVATGHGGTDILVNNAGVALGGTFRQVAEADFDWLMAVNFTGLVQMTRAFLPLLSASDDARLVNLSSIFGIVAPPGQAAYAASKFAVRGFTEALRHELAGTRVGVTLVHPGGVATAIAANARPPAGADATTLAEQKATAQRLLRMPPDQAGEIIVRAVEQRRDRVLVGRDAQAAELIQRLFPTRYWSLLRPR
ncbi:SDR family oxidoreductase [Azospirillum sp. B4]|uniref:SDR family NAD(P)-dependent oxidoreductase n=1 Tax=Azospirillum sp. B4 TaxID=95605 RepID=UPI00034C0E0C|nr:SDR family NAD(P)-dependent oxidoreductase [Azospirillum sp. B4]